MKKHTIDAKGMKLGRVASEAARLLMGKDNTDFVRNSAPSVVVEIANAKAIDLSEKKLGTKEYVHYSGFPGGLRTETLDQALTKKGIREVLRKTIFGMLPKNKLRSVMIKNLIVNE